MKVKITRPRGRVFIEKYGRHDGSQFGRSVRAALVSVEAPSCRWAPSSEPGSSASTPPRGSGAATATTLEALRELHAKIGDLLVDSPVS